MTCEIGSIERTLTLGPGTAEWTGRHAGVHDALVAAGKCWALGDASVVSAEWCERLERIVSAYLTHAFADLRDSALRTLTVYWALPAYRDVARAMASGDPDEDVRASALDGWAAYARGGSDPEAVLTFARLLRDRREPAVVRSAAYRSLLAASGHLGAVPPQELSRLLDVPADVDGRVG